MTNDYLPETDDVLPNIEVRTCPEYDTDCQTLWFAYKLNAQQEGKTYGTMPVVETTATLGGSPCLYN